MKYRKGYKYQVAEDEHFSTSIYPDNDVVTPRIELHKSGLLIVREGYAWDGTSGPVVDRKTNQTGSLAHDALYQLMRMELLPHSNWRAADREFARIIKLKGAWSFTVWSDMIGLKLARGAAAHPSKRKRVYSAP